MALATGSGEPSQGMVRYRIGHVDAAVVEARGLVKRFGTLAAVDGIDLSLAPGRIYGLLGPNGSGKTTLIRLLAGLATPTAGEVDGAR